MIEMNSKEKGDVAEMKIKTRLVEDGLIVSDPHTENCQYDFIVDDGESLHKIQAKTGRKEDRAIKVDLMRRNPRSGGDTRHTYNSKDVDYFIVYNDEEGIFCIPFEDAPETEITLRLESKISNKKIKWADEYRLDEGTWSN